MALPKTVLYRIRKSSNSKAELECRQELMPTPTDPDDSCYTIQLSIAEKHRSFSNRIYDDDISELLKRSNYVIKDQSIDIWDAHQFLYKSISDHSRLSAADMIYNLISSNPIPYIEELYHELMAYLINPENYSIQKDEFDEIHALLFDNAAFVCKYMRQLLDLYRNRHQTTDSILVFENYNTSAERIGRGESDLCWTDTILTILYRPYISKDEIAAEPWKISIKECKSYTGKDASSNPSQKRVTEIRFSNEDYINFIDTICNALEQYKFCTNQVKKEKTTAR